MAAWQHCYAAGWRDGSTVNRGRAPRGGQSVVATTCALARGVLNRSCTATRAWAGGLLLEALHRRPRRQQGRTHQSRLAGAAARAVTRLRVPLHPNPPRLVGRPPRCYLERRPCSEVPYRRRRGGYSPALGQSWRLRLPSTGPNRPTRVEAEESPQVGGARVLRSAESHGPAARRALSRPPSVVREPVLSCFATQGVTCAPRDERGSVFQQPASYLESGKRSLRGGLWV